MVDKLELQQTTFRNPTRVISDKVTDLTESKFMICCTNQGIDPMKITIEMKRVNGQIERIQRTMCCPNWQIIDKSKS